MIAALAVIKAIALLANLPEPNTYEEYYFVLRWVDRNYPQPIRP